MKIRRHAFSHDRSVLARIRQEDLDLAVWVRRAPAAAKRFTRFCPPTLLPNARFVIGPDQDLRPRVLDACDWSRKLAVPFAEDVAMLADFYRAVSGAKKLLIRLDHVTNDGCRLFHVDHVKLRLACTYRGVGSEWLAESNVSRDGIGKGNNALVVRNARVVRHMCPWNVALQKGELFSGTPGTGLAHRSPPVASAFEARLVLIVDDADGGAH